MNHELICSWLGLEPGEWPPNHYRLLGLKPGEGDPQLIEQQVHQRLDALRCYQVRHPEQATEAMNRLAQAFDCLTEPGTKQRYDSDVLGLVSSSCRSNTPPSLPSVPTILMEASAPADTRTPRPKARSSANIVLPPLPPMPPAPTEAMVPEAVPIVETEALPRPVPPPPAPPAEKICPISVVARCHKARCGLSTRWSLFRRVRRTRAFLDVWNRAGKYLGVKRRTALKEAEDQEELAELCARIKKLRRRFPRILGEAGQPGCLVLCLARHDPVPTFLSLEPGQRDALRRDWQAGRDLLLAHRDFLREQATELRLMTRGQRFQRAVRSFLFDQPGILLLLLLLAAFNALLWWSWLHRTRS